MTKLEAIRTWQTAKTQELGIKVKVESENDAGNIRTLLYVVKRELADPELEQFVISFIPSDMALFLTRKTVELEQ